LFFSPLLSEPLDGLVTEHLAQHGGAVRKSLAAVSVGRSTREELGRLGDPDIEGTLGHVAPPVGSTHLDPLRARPDFQALMLDLEFPSDPCGPPSPLKIRPQSVSFSNRVGRVR
jgi:hypothetical protein